MSKIQSADRKPSQAYGVGRICENPECATILSRYNPDEVCGLCRLKGYETRAEIENRRLLTSGEGRPDSIKMLTDNELESRLFCELQEAGEYGVGRNFFSEVHHVGYQRVEATVKRLIEQGVEIERLVKPIVYVLKR